MAKKYFLAIDPIIFDSIEEAVSYIENMQRTNKEIEIDKLVIGSLVGKLEQNTSFVIRSNNKVKRIKTKDLPVPTPEPVRPVLDETPEEEEPVLSVIQCSFCHRPKVKTTVIDRLPTHLCEEHLSIEKELLNVGN